MEGTSLIVLAGGKSSRMKTNKAFLPIGNAPLIETIIHKLRDSFQEIIVVTNDAPLYSHLKVRTITDIIPKQGPLSGIHAGLIASKFNYSFILACDMPFVNAPLSSYLVRQAEGCDVVVPVISGFYETTCAVYSKNCLPYIESNLKRGVRKVLDFYRNVKVLAVYEKELSRYCKVDQAFLNLNTPHDYKLAQRIIATG
ncbi:MAG: molybdenum cofactor guanylyltransferase [Zhaonellaceae bacterium]|jgi:molybdopterin-guanine dinucleotide biosynthesis protein A|nr:molybdenum cofactor guanylyltransferase [Clostridia bacterium]